MPGPIQNLPELKKTAKKMFLTGASCYEIAEAVGRKPVTVWGWIREGKWRVEQAHILLNVALRRNRIKLELLQRIEQKVAGSDNLEELLADKDLRDWFAQLKGPEKEEVSLEVKNTGPIQHTFRLVKPDDTNPD